MVAGDAGLVGVEPHIAQAPAKPGRRQAAARRASFLCSFRRDNWLSNRVFQSYDDLLDHCCDAWNKLVNQPWHIMTIGLRDWAHRF
jgi:hypothetical protein